MKLSHYILAVFLSVIANAGANGANGAIEVIARHGDEQMGNDGSMNDMHGQMEHQGSEKGGDNNEMTESQYVASQTEATSSASSLAAFLPIPHVPHHMHGVPILDTPLLPIEKAFWENYDTTTYFTVQSNNKLALYIHVVLLTLAFVFVYPIGLVFSSTKSKWSYIIFLAHAAMVLVSLFSYAAYVKTIPDIYPGNVYGPMCWVMGFMTIGLVVFGILRLGYEYNSLPTFNEYLELGDEESNSNSITLYDLPRSGSGSPEFHLDDEENTHEPDYSQVKTSSGSMIAPGKPKELPRFFDRILSLGFVRKLVNYFGKFTVHIFDILKWSCFLYFLVLYSTMTVVLGRFGKGKTIFNLLAHYIKGGIFFSFGLLTLARYCGAFAKKGWAWNHKYVTVKDLRKSRWCRMQSSGMCSMEMIESSMILAYGCSDIFLEHLANPGGAWIAKDLEHVSIAFIYLGAGLCGVITEIKLSDWRYERAMADLKKYNSGNTSGEENEIVKGFPGFSPNPFPIFTVFWTGVLMSSHQQASQLSTSIHAQWGQLFSVGTIFRFLTYILMMLLPPRTSLALPTRPITELITSFALLSGGLIFIESTDQLVLSFEYRGYTMNFILSVSLGFVALIMAWEMFLFAFKDWREKRYN